MSEYNIVMQSLSSGYQRETMYQNMIKNVNVKLPTIAASVEKLVPAERPTIDENGKIVFYWKTA